MAPVQLRRGPSKSRRRRKSRPLSKPRPLPKPRRPLRERCQTGLEIIPISYREWNKVYDCSHDMVLVFEQEEERKGTPAGYFPPPSPNLSLIYESHLVEIVDGLCIALMDNGNDIRRLRNFGNKPFTHVVQLDYMMPITCKNGRKKSFFVPSPKIQEAPRSAPVQHLKLNCFANSRWMCPERTAVGPKELRAARDFLTLALPTRRKEWLPEELRKDGWNEQEEHAHDSLICDNENDDPDAQMVTLAFDYGLDALLNEPSSSNPVESDEKVNVLIVGPAYRAVDVLSVLFCYLAFVEGVPVRELANTEYFDDVWESVVLAPGCMKYVERIARRG